MSADATHDKPSIRCKGPGCNTHGKRWEFHHGKFCSPKCETRHDGREQLAKVKFDHCRCCTCFHELKQVSPPKPDFEFTERGHEWTLDEGGEPTLQYYSQKVTREAATGFQFLTSNAGKGEKQRGDHVITGTICERCGNTDHTHHEPVLSGRGAISRLATLLAEDDDVTIDFEELHRVHQGTTRQAVANALSEKMRNGEEVDPEATHRFWEGTGDLDLAIGRAIQD